MPLHTQDIHVPAKIIVADQASAMHSVADLHPLQSVRWARFLSSIAAGMHASLFVQIILADRAEAARHRARQQVNDARLCLADDGAWVQVIGVLAERVLERFKEVNHAEVEPAGHQAAAAEHKDMQLRGILPVT